MSAIILSRFMIELTSPLSINSSDRELLLDNKLARDWNGLPYIPGTSITGVLRSLISTLEPELNEDKWFGCTSSENGNSAGSASQIVITDGLALNSHSQLLSEPLIMQNEIVNDPLYSIYMNNYFRDRTRINLRGVSSNRAKFDVLYLPAGARFVFDVYAILNSEETVERDKKIFDRILAYMGNNGFTLGSGKNNGFGRFVVKGSYYKQVDLSDMSSSIKVIRDFTENRIVPLCKDPYFSSNSEDAPIDKYEKLFSFKVKVNGSWKFGKGDYSANIKDKDKQDNSKTDFSMSDEKIVWNNNVFESEGLTRNLVLTGSALKGLIAHRIDYHLRRLNGNFAGSVKLDDDGNISYSSELLSILGKVDSNNNSAEAGKIIMIDQPVNYEQKNVIKRTHNKIDRFTGGVINGALFTEERIYDPSFSIEMLIDRNALNTLNDNLKKAICCTIEDIKLGTLPLCSSSSRSSCSVEIAPDTEFINQGLYEQAQKQE